MGTRSTRRFRQTRGTLDLGLFSDKAATLDFYEHVVGVPFDYLLQHSPTYQERFYAIDGGHLKVNYSTEPMEPGVSGYCALALPLASATERRALVDPEGIEVTVAPRGALPFGVGVQVADLAAQRRFLVDALGAQATDSPGRVVLGSTAIDLVEVPGSPPASPTWRRGFNYILVPVDDVLAAHEICLAHGAEHGMRPIRLADRCVFSWFRDPNGNWIELVQYGDDLPEVERADSLWPEITDWRNNGTVY